MEKVAAVFGRLVKIWTASHHKPHFLFCAVLLFADFVEISTHLLLFIPSFF